MTRVEERSERTDVAHLKLLGDDRGGLVAIEGGRDVPFAIARVYYIFGTKPGVERGFHAHIALRQFAVCVQGSCEILLDDGHHRRWIALDRPTAGIAIEPMVWHEMRNFSPDAVLMVLADDLYSEADYIRDYKRFQARVGAGS